MSLSSGVLATATHIVSPHLCYKSASVCWLTHISTCFACSELKYCLLSSWSKRMVHRFRL